MGVILSEAKDPGRRVGSFAALRMTLLFTLAPFSTATAQLDYGREFSATAEPLKIAVGDSITLRFRVHLNERDLLTDTVPRPIAELPPGVRVLSVERLQRGADRAFTGEAVLAVYRPGKQRLPVFGVPWVQVVTGHRGVFAHDPVEVEVTSSIPAGNPALRDIREPDMPPSLGVLWVLLGAALVGGAAWLVTRRRARPVIEAREPEPPPPPPPLPPDPFTAAQARLDAIAAERWADRGEVARHYEAVADALRDYLEAAESLPARERTTTELLWSLPPRLSEGGLRRRVQDVLGEADLVKFAKLRPHAGDAERYVERARDLLERWHRAARAPVGEELDAVR